MEVIDELVLGAVEAQAFAPVQLENLVRAATERSDANRKTSEAELIWLRRRGSKAEAGLTGHYEAIEKGMASLKEPVLKQRMEELRLQASETRTCIAYLKARRSVDPAALTLEVVQRTSPEISRRLREEPPQWRETWLPHVVSDVAIQQDRIVIR